MTPEAWVVGAGGLLGRALMRTAPCPVRAATGIDWSDPSRRRDALREQWLAFRANAADRRSIVIWAAGSAGVAADDRQAESELAALREFLADAPSPDAFFLASSAGGVYADSTQAPFDASAKTSAVSAYGRMKLAQEELVSTLPGRVVIGRITNLYGPQPGRRIGLVNRLCLAAANRQAVNLFVPLDTIRDYLYVDDAATLIWRSMLKESAPAVRVEVIGSGRPVTVAAVVATVQEVAHRKVPLALGADPSATSQPADTRVIPTWAATDSRFEPLDLAIGVQRVLADLVTSPR